MIITHSDLAAMKFCNRGARLFFERHGLNWQTFMQQGIDDSELVGIDDEMMRQVVERARLRVGKGTQ